MAPTSLILLLALASTAFAGSADFKNLITENIEKCKKTHEDVEAVIMHVMKEEDIPDGDEAKCAIACVMTGIGLIKDNKYIWEKSVSLNKIKHEEKDVEKANAVAKKCGEIVPQDLTDVCELGKQIMECCLEEGKKVGLHPPKYD